jgi:hypothetical protein
MDEMDASPDTAVPAESEGSGRLRRGGLVGLGAAVVASGVLMITALALAVAPSAYYGPPPTQPPAATASATVSDNGTVTCVGDGFKLGSDATCSIASTPTLLGHMTANASGHVQGTFALPGDITAGTHTVTINGIDPSGNPLSLSFQVQVSAAAAAAARANAAAGGAGTGTGTDLPRGVTVSPQLTG